MIAGGFVPSLLDRKRKKMTTAASAEDRIAERAVAMLIDRLLSVSPVNMSTNPGGLSEPKVKDDPSQKGSQPEANSPEELLFKVAEPFRSLDEDPVAAARRIKAEVFSGLFPNVWRRACERLGEAVALIAAVLVAKCRAFWKDARQTIRNPVAYLGHMLSATDVTTVLTQARAVVANRRKAERVAEAPAPEPKPVEESEPQPEPAPEPVEPVVVETPAPEEQAPEPEPTSEPVATPEPPPEPDPAPAEPPRRLTEAEIEDEEYEVLRCLLASEIPSRIAMAPPETQAKWQSRYEQWSPAYPPKDYKTAKSLRDMLLPVLHDELDRLGVLPLGYRKR